jgi:hypothetical protein
MVLSHVEVTAFFVIGPHGYGGLWVGQKVKMLGEFGTPKGVCSNTEAYSAALVGRLSHKNTNSYDFL